MSHPKGVQLYFTTVARLEMLLELALDNELTGDMLHQTRSYSQSEGLHVLEFVTGDFKYLKWFLNEAHSINLICSYETRDLREPITHLDQETVAEMRILPAGMTERYDSLPWREPEEVS
jgi:hypothetical protein